MKNINQDFTAYLNTEISAPLDADFEKVKDRISFHQLDIAFNVRQKTELYQQLSSNVYSFYL